MQHPLGANRDVDMTRESPKQAADALSARQALFIGEYVISGNATQAAIKAGYSEKTACEQGSRLLANVKVAREVEQRQQRRVDRLNLSADFVLENILRTAEKARDVGEYSAALKGYELLGKYLKLFTDKTELSGKDNVLQVTVRNIGVDL